MTTRTRKRPAAQRHPSNQTPRMEPTRKATVAGRRGVPVARSWAEDAQPVHHQLVAELLRGFPEGRLTRISGWDDQAVEWMACHDHGGAWPIPYDEDAAVLDLAEAQANRPQRQAGAVVSFLRRFALLLTLALAAWTASILLDASHATEEVRATAGWMAVAVVVLVGGVLILRARLNRGQR